MKIKFNISSVISIVCLIVAVILIAGLFTFLKDIDFSTFFEDTENDVNLKIPDNCKVLEGTWTWNDTPQFTQDFILEDVSFKISGKTETYDTIVIDYLDTLSSYGNFSTVIYKKGSISVNAYLPEDVSPSENGWLVGKAITFEKKVIVTEKFYNEFIKSATQEVSVQ